MNPNFSEELQIMYRNILLQQHNLAYANMIAAFSAAGNIRTLPGTPSTPSSFTLDTDIPKDEIECEVELVVVKNLRDSLKKLQTNLNGLHGKKFGFREVIEIASARTPYPVSPSTSAVKRSRLSMDGSFDALATPLKMTPTTPLTPQSLIDKDEANSAKKQKLADNTATTLNDSTTSSHDGHLQIDWNDPSADSSDKTEKIKTEKPDEEKDEADDDITDDKPTAETSQAANIVYKPSQLRIERMRNIQKKKPKFNVDPSDLEYHSNMARHFPGSENRTPDQQMRREKNTLAARISRTKNKAYERMLENKSLEATTENINMKRRVACLRVYANSLMKLSGLPDPNFSQMWEANIKDIVCSVE